MNKANRVIELTREQWLKEAKVIFKNLTSEQHEAMWESANKPLRRPYYERWAGDRNGGG